MDYLDYLSYPKLDEWSRQASPQVWSLALLYVCINWMMPAAWLPRVRNTRIWAQWNLFLAIQSFFTFVAIVPWWLHLSWNEVICGRQQQWVDDQWITKWNAVFVISKIFELGDTVFLWLDKKQVKFLHWFHHATVLLYCWHSMETRSTSGFTFVLMNSGIHAIMYFQQFLAMMKIKAPSWISAILTTLQISQMFVGIFVQSYVLDKLWSEQPCGVPYANVIGGFLMQLAYLILFLQYAFDRQVFGIKED